MKRSEGALGDFIALMLVCVPILVMCVMILVNSHRDNIKWENDRRAEGWIISVETNSETRIYRELLDKASNIFKE